MGWKKLLVIVGIFVVIPAYFLYTPLPAGYSTMSACKIQLISSASKIVDAVATLGEVLGVASFANIYRELIHFFAAPFSGTDPQVQETDLVFDGVTVRMYEPVKRSDVLPGIVYYHGGGFIFGNLDIATSCSRRLCKDTKSVIISVEYRLAPEALFPAGFEDCVKAAKHFMTNAAEFYVDPQRIAVAGESAGGNLAGAVALKLRDEGFQPSIKLQVLVNPTLQGLDFMTPSMIQNEFAPLLPRRTVAFAMGIYLEGNTDKIEAFLNNDHVSPSVKKMKEPYIDVTNLPSKYLVGYEKPSVETGNETMWNELKDKLLNPYFSPLVAERLDGLPRTYIFTSEYDPLRDDGFLYADRLRSSGVTVQHRHMDSAIHAVFFFQDTFSEASEAFEQMTMFIADNL